jgi:hypothetical protein
MIWPVTLALPTEGEGPTRFRWRRLDFSSLSNLDPVLDALLRSVSDNGDGEGTNAALLDTSLQILPPDAERRSRSDLRFIREAFLFSFILLFLEDV